MVKLHFLNVNQGDCIIIEHSSGRVTVFDICAGNTPSAQGILAEALTRSLSPAKGNFRMCDHPTNPLDYLSNKLGVTDIWRFILSHPDMDHLDGFNALLNQFRVLNFWDSGARKKKPDFSNFGGYKEQDWDRYARVIGGSELGTQSLTVRADSRFKYANSDDTFHGSGDQLYILAPDQSLINEGNRTQDFNDASYVVLYNSSIGKILLAGDAHDATWEYVLRHHSAAVSNVALLIAPHHGRKSGRSYDFLNHVNPKLTLFGCAPSEHLAYDAWNYRDLAHITNNQCGCVVAEGTTRMDIYVENDTFAARVVGNTALKNQQGFHYLCTIS